MSEVRNVLCPYCGSGVDVTDRAEIICAGCFIEWNHRGELVPDTGEENRDAP